MTENERKTVMILADTIQGEINRMCVTQDMSEVEKMCGYAITNLVKLAWLRYNTARFERGVNNI